MPMVYRRSHRRLRWRRAAVALLCTLLAAVILGWEDIERALVARAWNATLTPEDRITPWPGAGYWPAARLVIPRSNGTFWLYLGRERHGSRPHLEAPRWPHDARVNVGSGPLGAALDALQANALVQVYLPGGEGWSYRVVSGGGEDDDPSREQAEGLIFMRAGEKELIARFAGPAPRPHGLAGTPARGAPAQDVRRFP